jgi:hypothetical protein
VPQQCHFIRVGGMRLVLLIAGETCHLTPCSPWGTDAAHSSFLPVHILWQPFAGLQIRQAWWQPFHVCQVFGRVNDVVDQHCRPCTHVVATCPSLHSHACSCSCSLQGMYAKESTMSRTVITGVGQAIDVSRTCCKVLDSKCTAETLSSKPKGA